MENRLFTVKEAAEFLGRSERVIQERANSKRYPNAVKKGRIWMIPEEDLVSLNNPSNPKAKS